MHAQRQMKHRDRDSGSVLACHAVHEARPLPVRHGCQIAADHRLQLRPERHASIVLHQAFASRFRRALARSLSGRDVRGMIQYRVVGKKHLRGKILRAPAGMRSAFFRGAQVKDAGKPQTIDGGQVRIGRAVVLARTPQLSTPQPSPAVYGVSAAIPEIVYAFQNQNPFGHVFDLPIADSSHA